jgi:predicted permease
METFERIAGIILPVFIIVGVGYGYAHLRASDIKPDMAAINRVSMEVLAPLLVFSALASKNFDIAQYSMLILAGVLISLGSGVMAWPIARLLGYDLRSFVPPMIYKNSGNMGLPLAVLAFGPSGLSAAVALFTAGSLVYFTLGIRIVESGIVGRRTAFLRFFASPMMLAMIAGIVFAIARVNLPAPLFQALKLLGEAAIPLMLFALGVRMLDVNFKSWRIGLLGAIICPVTGLAMACILDSILTLPPAQRGQMYLFASLPPAVFCFMVAEQYQQEPDKVASIVLLGNLAALIFVPIGLWFGLS